MTWYHSFILPYLRLLAQRICLCPSTGRSFSLSSLLAIYHLIRSEPTVNFGSQRNLLRAQCVISKSNVKLCSARWFICRYNIARMFAYWNSIAWACFIFPLSTLMTSINYTSSSCELSSPSKTSPKCIHNSAVHDEAFAICFILHVI